MLRVHLLGMERELTSAAWLPEATVADAAAGDSAAFARIVAAHHDDMARVCYVICGDQDAAQDAVQAAWPIAWRKLRTLRDPSLLRSWLVTIAANEARQTLRRQRRVRIVELEVGDVRSDADEPGRAVVRADLVQALARLSHEDRQLLALRYVAGFDAPGLARAIGISQSGVRSRLARAAARLRTELADD